MARESKLRVSKVHLALNLPMLSKGVSPKMLGLIYAPSALIALMLFSTVGLMYAPVPFVLSAVVHGGFTWAFKKDPKILEILSKYSLMADEYHPHSRENLPVGLERPVKFGRGLRM